MKKLLSAIREILSDETQRLSSKRVVGIMCAVFLCITLYQNSFSEEHIAPSAILVETVGAVTFGCLGLSSVDKFIKTKKEEPKTED
jgi:hypothetical protein